MIINFKWELTSNGEIYSNDKVLGIVKGLDFNKE